MSPQENQLLQNFLQQLLDVKLQNKDQEVASLIDKAAQQQPDAVYLLVQRALIQDQAMLAAQQKITQLEEDLSRAKPAATESFFGNSGAWGNSASTNASTSSRFGSGANLPAANNTVMSAPGSNYASPGAQFSSNAQASPQAARPSFFSGNAGSMLGTVAATAAGVAAGAFLFQGLGSMMGGGAHHGAGSAATPATPATPETPAASAAASEPGADQGLIANSFPEESTTLADAGSDMDVSDFSDEF
jgi:hypothetical protein